MNADEERFEAMRRVAVMTIAGSDSGGNAGIQADLRACHVFGVHGCTAITALTAQNPFGVAAVLTADATFVGMQIEEILGVYNVQALKTGMLATAPVIEEVAAQLLAYARIPKVCDPVMVATSGARLLEEEAIASLRRELLPLATLATPNLPEAELLSGRTIKSMEQAATCARALADDLGCAVLVKGGHDSGPLARDLLYDGRNLVYFSTPRIEAPLSTHGTGCSLSAAIAASLACGRSLVEAVAEGKAYVYESIRTSLYVGEAATVLGTPRGIPRDIVEISGL